MKVEYNQVPEQVPEKKVNTREKLNSGKFEWFLSRAAVSALVLLVLVQAAFFNPVFSSIIKKDRSLEGALLTDEAYFFIPCRMELKLLNLDNCPDLEILVNGEKRDSFNDKTVLLELRDGDVVELDAGSVLEKAVVQVSAVSENIAGYLGKTMTITDGIKRVALVRPVHP